MFDIPDNYDIWLSHEEDIESRLSERLVCEECKNPIQDEHYYDICGTVLCEECLKLKYRRAVE